MINEITRCQKQRAICNSEIETWFGYLNSESTTFHFLFDRYLITNKKGITSQLGLKPGTLLDEPKISS